MHQNASGCYTPHECAAGAADLLARPTALESKAVDGVGIVLSVQQEQAIELFVTGRRDVEVAAALRIHRTTVTRWRLHHLGLRAALSRRRQEVWGAAGDRFRGMLDSAVDVLQRQLADDDPSVSFRAARLLVQMAGGPLAPPDQPTDPLALLDEHARRTRRSTLADDPAERPVQAVDRVAALKDLIRRSNGLVEPDTSAMPETPIAARPAEGTESEPVANQESRDV